MNDQHAAEAAPVRVLVVARRALNIDSLRLPDAAGVEVLDSSNDPTEVVERLETLQPDVLLLDLMFPRGRSIEVTQDVSDWLPGVRIVGLAPDPPPYEQIVLATRAGALGFVSTTDEPDEISAAIRQVNRGEPWLPTEQTYEVLQDVSREFEVTASERRGRLGAIVLGLLPLGAAFAAFIAVMWRSYWGGIGVRPVDLGVDPSARVGDAIIAILLLFGVFGPLLFVGGAVTVLRGRLDARPDARRVLTKVQGVRILRVPIGRLVFLVAGAILALVLAGHAYAQADAERELAEKHAPVVRLVEQEEECGSGEPYDPIDIDLILENNEVVFRGPWDRTNVVKVAPAEADLDETRVDYHLDFPGDALEPGCDFEKFHQRTIGDTEPTVYARVITEEGKSGKLALQYWFYYVFNDFNNKHEGDWEMIQLVFDADDAADALSKDPVATGYSQHEGAERSDWGEDKLQIVDGARPVVYPAAGSHANYYTPALFLGRSAAEGVGCDDTTKPHREIRPAVAWVPFDEDDYLAEYPWLGYLGRWGEKQPAFFNGPTGPNLKSQWTKPITWSEEKWRDQAFAMPTGSSWNTSATDFFCGAVAGGSSVLTAFTQNPWPVVIALGALIVLAFWGASRTQWASSTPRHIARRRAWGQIVAATRRMYTGHFKTFLTIGLLFGPIGVVIAGLQAILFYFSSLEAFADSAGESNAVVGWFAMSFGLLFNLIGLTIVQAATARAMVTIDAGENVSARRVYRSVLTKIWTLMWALLRVVVVVGILNLTVIGIPLAIWLIGRWAFIGQVVELENGSQKHALRRSSQLVAGRWWKVASIAIVMAAIALISGPFIGALMLLITDATFSFVNIIAAVIYVFLIPLAAIGTTYVYFDCRVRDELDAHETTERAAVLPAEI